MAQTKGYVYTSTGDRVIAGTGNYVYILLEASSQIAYLEGAGSVVDSSQSAYLVGGGDPASDSQSAFLSGTDTDLSSKSAYLFGSIDVDSSVSAYLDCEIIVASQSAYLTGPIIDMIDDCEDHNTWSSIGTLSNSTDAKQGTYSSQCSATTLAGKFYKGTFGTPYADTDQFSDPAIHFWFHIPDASVLSDSGEVEISSTGITGNQELYWRIVDDEIIDGPFGNNIQLVDGWNEITLRLADALAAGGTYNGDLKYFRIYYPTTMNQIVKIDYVYAIDFVQYKDSISAFLTSDDTLAVTDQSAFLEGHDHSMGSKSAYMFGGTTLHDSQDAYLDGDPIPESSSKSAFLSGGTTVIDSQAAYMEMGTIADDFVSVYLAAESVSSGIQSAYLEGQHPRSSQAAFLLGQWAPTADDSISAFLECEGAWPFSDDFTGDDEDDWSEFLWFTESVDD